MFGIDEVELLVSIAWFRDDNSMINIMRIVMVIATVMSAQQIQQIRGCLPQSFISHLHSMSFVWIS